MTDIQEKLYSITLVPYSNTSVRKYPKKWVYAQGVSALMMPFQEVKSFMICAYRLEGSNYIHYNITRHFLYFQQLYKWRYAIRKQSLRLLRLREISGKCLFPAFPQLIDHPRLNMA
jgi:hypothetical protein